MKTIQAAEKTAQQINKLTKETRELIDSRASLFVSGAKKIRANENKEVKLWERLTRQVSKLTEEQFYSSQTLVNLDYSYKQFLTDAKQL